MDDGFIEQQGVIAQKIVKQQQESLDDRREAQEPQEYMENVYDFHQFTANPMLSKISQSIKEIDKNWVLGNYSAKDEKIVLLSDALLSDLEVLLPARILYKSKIRAALLRDIFARITISRGRKGFAAKLFVTQIGSTKAEIVGLDKKKAAGLFNLGPYLSNNRITIPKIIISIIFSSYQTSTVKYPMYLLHQEV